MNRDRFPGLADGWARFDGPGGSPVLDGAADAITGYLRSGAVANLGGAFDASARTTALLRGCRERAGALLGADPACVAFGPSMTALTLSVAAAVADDLGPGDEVVVTRLDHDANVAPWLLACERSGATVRWAEPDPATLELPTAAVEAVLSERTRWVAVTGASNVVGTVPDVPAIAAAVHAAGARLFVDAVHLTPHRPVSLDGLGADLLACSAYKWFGPHVGVLAGREQALAALRPWKLRPSPGGPAERFERGTLPFELLAGVDAAAEYLLSLDWDAVRAHEDALLERMVAGLSALDGVRLIGSAADRTPTVLFTADGFDPAAVAAACAREQVAVGHGWFYAVELGRLTGRPDGGVRAGALHMTSAEDVDRLVGAVDALLQSSERRGVEQPGSSSGS